MISSILLLLAAASSAFADTPNLSDFPISEQDLARRVLAHYAPEHHSTPGDTFGRDHAFCGTFQALALRDEVSRASSRTKETLAFLFQRPGQTFSKTSPDGRFLIHYDKSGIHAVNLADADQNGHPDYVDTVADVFDEVWRKEVTELGYRSPPPDADGVYDIYVRDLSSTGQFGVTFPESFSPTTPSYIEIENNFTDPVFTTQGIDALRFTAAHEFFHAVQFSYYLSIEAAWWYELTATWMQDKIVTDVNDHYSLVEGYLVFPEAAMYEPPPISFRPYGAMIMGVYLASVYGETTIRNAFEDLAARSPNPYTIEDSDGGLPGGFAGFLPRYWVWNYLTGPRAQAGRYYPEASGYSEVKSQVVTPIGGLTLGGATQVQSLGATYARVNTSGKSGGLRVTFDLPAGATWNLDMVLVQGTSIEVIRPAERTVTIPNAGDYDEVVFIPSVLSLEGGIHDMSYTVQMAPSFTAWSDLGGDFDHSGAVGFEDFLTFSESFGKPAVVQHVPCDFNADGHVDFTDFLVFASRFGNSR